MAKANPDPTKTITLRKSFSKKITAKFRIVSHIVSLSVLIMDCFGLKRSVEAVSVLSAYVGDSRAEALTRVLSKNKYKGLQKQEQVTLFLEWFRALLDDFVLTPNRLGLVKSNGVTTGSIWTDKYIRISYEKGILWARHMVRNDSLLLSELGLHKLDVPLRSDSVKQALEFDSHYETLLSLYILAANGLRGITDVVHSQSSRTLTSDLITGASAYVVLKNITDRINKIGIIRGNSLAMTEVIRAHHMASIREYERLGIETIKVYAEWLTAGDSRVCPDCRSLEGRVFAIKEIINLIPLHPLCRCAAVPISSAEAKKIRGK